MRELAIGTDVTRYSHHIQLCISSISKYLSDDACKSGIHAVVTSRLDYTDSLNQTHIRKLQKHYATKVIYKGTEIMLLPT